jgi:hypothetical protein
MDSLTVRALTENDYHETLVNWWEQWGWEAPPLDFLPDNGKGGIMIMDGDTPVCAGFMYLTNSKVSWVDWIVSSKEYTDREKRKQSLLLLVGTLTEMCKRTGSRYCYALIKHPGLVNTYKELGYSQGDSYTNEMIKIL